MESDVQQASKVNKQEYDFGEGSASDQHISKIPRPSKSVSPRKKVVKDLERPSSAKSFVSLENKYRASMVKYQKELKEMQTQNEKLNSLRENMERLRDEMQEKGQSLPPVPNIPSMMSISFLSPRSPSSLNTKGKRPKQADGSAGSKELVDDRRGSYNLDDRRGSYNLDVETLQLIKVEVPNLEQTLKGLEVSVMAAHKKQNSLENHLDTYKQDIATIMNEFENIASIKRNSQLLIQELEKIKNEFHNERTLYRKELDLKDEELQRLRGALEIEFSKRKVLEDACAEAKQERDHMKQDCQDYIQQIEKMQTLQTIIPHSTAGGPQELAILNGQLQFEVGDLKTKLSLTQRKLSTITDENDKHKQEIRKLMVEREEIKNEFVSHCQQILFEKENQIYSIKSKMDSIVNLKNTMVSREGRGEPFFSIDLVMNINDANALKKEVVGLHKRLISFEETRSDMEQCLSKKEVKIQALEEELESRSQTIDRMEHFVDLMKKRDKENNELFASLDISAQLTDNQQLLEEGGKEEMVKELVKWQEKQRETVAVLEKELRTSEERYSLCEQRRVRNEERIALLQLKLAKYQYFR